jgi:hypothetical protein
MPAPNRRTLLRAGLGASAVVVSAALGGAWWAWRKASDPAPLALDTETEAAIDASAPCGIKLSYFQLDRHVVVIDFPDLLTQGLTLDRVAAFVEKADAPRDRVLSDASLSAAIAADGDTVESYYYGHDYQAADLARFYQTAATDGVTLNAHEQWLHGLLTQLGWLTPGAAGAIITVPAAGGDIDAGMRAVILHHEISHGAFYTDPTYRAYAESFWYSLTEADRAAFTGFLGREGYDTSDTELMLNETQAYLVFTPDSRFFNAAAVGMSDAFVAQLRDGYIAGMPDFWLRPLAGANPPTVPAATPHCTTSTAANWTGRTCLCFARRASARFTAV